VAIQENNGLIEGVKRSVITALNAALDEAYADPSDVVRRVVGNIEMEYPLERVKYPGIWVQFSFTEVRRAAIAEMHYREETLPSGEPFNRRAMTGFFKGTVSLSLVALSSVERDKIADALVNLFLFADVDELSNRFFDSMEADEFIRITANKDQLRPRGQSTSVGAPWDPGEVVYEDGYSFDIQGQFYSRRVGARTELVRLREIVVESEMDVKQNVGEWV